MQDWSMLLVAGGGALLPVTLPAHEGEAHDLDALTPRRSGKRPPGCRRTACPRQNR